MTSSLAIDIQHIACLVLAGLAFFYIILPLWAMRQGIGWGITRTGALLLGYLIAYRVLLNKGMQQPVAILVGVGCGWVLMQFIPARSHHIPSRVKRKLISDYEGKTGKKYDSRKMELDHIWPHSRGGSNTVDNLRVISRAKNRRKGTKKPKPTDWF